MKRLLILVALATALSSSAAETHRYIVATAPNARAKALRALALPAGVERNVRELESVEGFAADLTDEEAAQLRRSPSVRYVSRTVAVHAVADGSESRTPVAEGSALQKAQLIPPTLDLIHARELWALTRGENVNIAVFDTGVDRHHADLAANIAGGYNTFTKQLDFDDDNRHGTHVFGIIGAIDNSVGIVGVSPRANIYSIKVLDSSGSGSDEQILAAIDWVLAWKHAHGGNWIVSMSLGSEEESVPESEGFRRLIDDGVLCIAAAGNDAAPRLLYPAALPNMVSVGAVDNERALATFSNTAPTLGVVAPGVSVLSTLPTGSVEKTVANTSDGVALTSATLVDAAAYTELSGKWVYCGYGGAGDFPAEVRGNIAVVTRGMDLSFGTKVRNAVAAGATAVIIIDNIVPASRMNWTLLASYCDVSGCHWVPEDLAYPWPLVLGVSAADGAKLLAGATRSISIGAWKDDYGSLSGTSMATPHVSGVAALIWSLAPGATARQVSSALRASAGDLGAPGYDAQYGHGLVNARAAAEWLAPGRFGLPPAAPPAKARAAH